MENQNRRVSEHEISSKAENRGYVPCGSPIYDLSTKSGISNFFKEKACQESLKFMFLYVTRRALSNHAKKVGKKSPLYF